MIANWPHFLVKNAPIYPLEMNALLTLNGINYGEFGRSEIMIFLTTYASRMAIWAT